MVSLRGSLAHEAAQRMLMSSDPRQTVEEFLFDLVHAADGDVVRYVDGDVLVIGRKSERGLYPPDW